MEASCLSLDMISNLPPTIIETILCLLPIQEAVRTSVLSKKWRYNWTKIPKLVFNEYTFKVSTKENQRKPFYAINQVLLLHQGPILEFTLSMDGADDGGVEMDQIITNLS
ncbi:F-box/FBD/LRR-repeat protein-like protein, partial [Tanacetum coccineum]